MAAPRAVAAFELDSTPADLVQQVRQRATALSATPAIHDGRPGAWFCGKRTFEHRGDVARDDRRACALGGKPRFPCIHRADPRALGVVQDRSVFCAGDMIFDKFEGERTSTRSG
jgi:hypothetical protein